MRYSIIRPSLRQTAVGLIFALALVGPLSVSAARAQLDENDREDAIGLDIQDKPEKLVERSPRSKADSDRLEALSLFAAGRMQEQQDDFSEALRLFQRALRHDPRSLPILREIVALSIKLDRMGEAVRYAMLAAELDSSNTKLLTQIANQLTDQGKLAEAIKLYEKAFAARGDKRTATYYLLRMEMGRLYALTKQADKAAAAFAEVMEALDKPAEHDLKPAQVKTLLTDPRRVYEAFADTFLAADKLDLADQAIERAETAKKEKASTALLRARVAAARKQHDEALKQLDAFFATHDHLHGTRPYEVLASSLEAVGRKGELVAKLEAMHKDSANAKNLPLAFFLAQQYAAAGRDNDAITLNEEVLKLQPVADVYQSLVKLYYKKKDYSALLRVAGEMVGKGGGLDSAAQELKTVSADQAALKGMADVARERFKKKPDDLNRDERLAMALLALEGKQLDLASEFFELALTIKAKPQESAGVMAAWGVGLLGAERYDDAAKIFRRAISASYLPSGDPTFYFYLATALEFGGHTDEALVAARHAASGADATPRVAARVPWVLYHAKRYEAAAAEYRKLIASFEGEYKREDVREAVRESRLVLSSIYVILKDMPKAEEALERVLDEYPGDVSASNDLGYLWADQNKNLDRAYEMVQRAVTAEPENVAYRDSLGWVYFRQGQLEKAVAELEKAAAGKLEKGSGTDGTILEHLGDVYQAMHQADKARNAFERSVKAYEEEKDADRLAEVKKKLEKLAGGT